MRNNYFAKLIKYIKNVYRVDKTLSKLRDERVNPTYSTELIIMIVLFGFLLRIRSFNELNLMIKNGEFKNLFPKKTKFPGIDAIRDTIKTIKIEELRIAIKNIVKKAIENKVFDNGTIEGYTVVAIDGTRLFKSNVKYCSKCLSTTVKGKNEYYHNGTVLSIIGDVPKITIDLEMYNAKIDPSKKDEGEQNAAKRLLSRVITTHKDFIDVVVYDALACNSKWFNHCKELNIDTIVRVKNNNNRSLRETKRLINKQKPVEIIENIKCVIKVYENVFTMNGVAQPLRFVKFEIKYKNNKRSQIMIVTTCMEMDNKTIYKIIKARWDIENCVFNNLKNNSNLEHCYVHGGNAVEVVLYLMFIANNLFQLFKMKRIRNHIPIQRELVRLLLKGLYLLKYDRQLIFSSG